MGLFNRMKEPVFLKQLGDSERQIEELRGLEPLLNTEGKAILKQDMKYLEWGITGEKNIAFELKNSHMPMYILHDLYLEDDGLHAQIDFLVFTRKICFVIECKNLYGNIEINEAGDFIRNIALGGRWKKEGIYSPLTQNERHLELIKKITASNKNSIISRFFIERHFAESHKSVVVLANPKTLLYDKNASKEVKEKVIRVDQLIRYIKEVYDKSNVSPCSDERLLAWAQSYLNMDKKIRNNFTQKYEKFKIQQKQSTPIDTCKTIIQETAKEEMSATDEKEVVNLDETPIYKELKAYRLKKSREEKVKPYFLYNDNQLKDLIAKMPRTKEDLKKISGFGEVKTDKYGEDIIRIIAKY